MSNTYAIADMHGRYDLFEEAWLLIQNDAGMDGGRVIFMGDMVDRGPKSRELITRLMMGPGVFTWTWDVIQGNHENIMLAAHMYPKENLKWWTRNGGGMTLKSYGYEQGDDFLPAKVPDEHLDWLARRPIWIEDTHRIYVHAGVPHDKSPDNEHQEVMQWMLWGEVGYDGKIIEDLPHKSGKHIVHGHHQDAKNPLMLPHRTNLDSFAWATGRLAIGVFDDNTPGGPIRILEAKGEPHPQYAT